MSHVIDGAEIIASVSDTLKTVYPERIVAQFYRKFPLLSEIKRTTKGIQIGPTSFAHVPLMIGENPGIGSRGFMEEMPSADLSQHEAAQVRLKNLYASLIVPGQLLKATSSEAAIAAYLTNETENLTVSAQRDTNRQLHGDGRGILANAAAGGPSLTVTVGAGQTKHLFRRRIIDIRDPATGVAIANGEHRRIVTVNPAANTITLDAAGGNVTTVGTEAIYNNGSRNVELTGLDAMVDDTNPALGNYLGVDANVVTEWRASDIDATGVGVPGGPGLTERLLQHAADTCDLASGDGANAKLLVTTHDARSDFLASLQTQKRYVNEVDFHAGFKALDWNGNMLVVDRDTPTGHLWGVDLQFVRMYQMADWEFLDQAGSRLQPDTDRRDAYIATLFKYCELATVKRSAHFRIRNIA